MTLPTASELDAWLAGYASYEYILSGLAATLFERTGVGPVEVLHFAVIGWLRAHNDAAAQACPNLPDLERRYSAARTPEARRDALRALLAARDTVMAHAESHAAVQAQAVEPLQLGLHPTGVGDANERTKPTRCTATAVNGLYRCTLPAGHTGSHHGGSS